MIEILSELLLFYYTLFNNEELGLIADCLDKQTKIDIVLYPTLVTVFLGIILVNLPDDDPRKKAVKEWFRKLFYGDSNDGKNPPQNPN